MIIWFIRVIQGKDDGREVTVKSKQETLVKLQAKEAFQLNISIAPPKRKRTDQEKWLMAV